MKKIVYLLLLLPVIMQAQDQNYIKTLTYKEETETSDPAKARANITYYDGLGRPVQQVAGKMATSGKDLVTHIAYDGFGRQTKEYLPYPSPASDLSFQSNAATDVLTYYSTPLSTPGLGPQETTGNPYSEKFFEPSPLNRVLKQAAPGDAWLGNPDPYNNDDHSVKFVYLANVDNEVKRLKATATWNATTQVYDIAFVSDSYYTANQLYKTVTKNENWIPASGLSNTTEEFKNKEGQVILKKTYNGSLAHETYYVYDQFGNLTYVLSPAANGSNTYVNTLGYQYKYDRRNRLAEKKLPGKQWEFIVYDPLDRPILSGPALTPFGGQTSVASDTGWLMTIYDAFGRVAITGWYQASVTTSTRQVAQAGMGATVLTAVRGSGTIDGVSVGYSNLTFPTGFKLLTVNYYDDYTWPGAPTLPSQIEGQNVRSTVKGLPTGSWVRVLNATGTADKETSYTLYDNRARPIRTNGTNYLGGYTQVDTKLDFDATPQYTITRHKRVAADTELVVREDFTYDSQDRLKTHQHKINTLTSVPLSQNTYDELGQLIKKNVGSYTSGRNNFVAQSIDYRYNIRGWLTSINNVNNLGLDLFAFNISYNTPTDHTSGNLSIDGLYNGNISETYWRSKSDNILRKYSYKYDHLNRLINAYYQKPNASVVLTGSYNENMKYDMNGNITVLNRTGGLDDATTQVSIDNLVYTYTPNSNQILKVEDNSGSIQGFIDAGSSDGIEYTYDLNGNMLKDINKGIYDIKYNHLNLPTEITIKGNKITYLYDASGKKLKKTVTEGSTSVVVDYLGGFQYKGGILQFFPTAEGYVDNTVSSSGTNSYNYVFQYKDHLGNVRLNYTVATIFGNNQEVIIKEESHYYPFGLKHLNYNTDYLEYQEIEGNIELYPPLNPTAKLKHNYKYNGKELQDELGLNMYDYGARNYDPALGRWMNIDPLAEDSRRWSPYNYGLDNPVFFIDPDGMKPRAGQSGTYYDWDEGGYRTAEGAEATFDEAMANHSGGGGIDPPKTKKEIENMTPEQKNEYWRQYNEKTLLPLSRNLIDFAFIADGAGALSELFTIKSAFKLTSLTGLFKNLLNKVSRFTVESSKFDYFFGRVVTGNEHNIQRSAQNLADLTTLGIKTEKDLMRVFNKAWNSPIINKIETTHGVSVIKSASVGKNGQAIQVSFFYKGGDMSVTPTVTTIIPKL